MGRVIGFRPGFNNLQEDATLLFYLTEEGPGDRQRLSRKA
jgi:1,4-dihydroxy-2-naphthoyl-CoA synthase